MGNLYIFILLVSVNFFVEGSFGAYLSDKDKAVENDKRRLEKLVDERDLLVKVYHDCVLDFKHKEKEQLKTTIQNYFYELKNDIINTLFLYPHPDYGLVSGLYDFLVREKSETAEEAFTKYEALLDLIRTNLESETVDDLSTMYWKRVEKFLTDPFDFLGKLSNVTNAMVYGYSPSVIPRQPNICIKTFIKHLITKGRMVMEHYQNCAIYFEKGQEKRVQSLAQKLDRFKADLHESILTDDEDGVYFAERVITLSLNQIITAGFYSMTVDYGFLYLVIHDYLHDVANDTHTVSQFWRAAIKFLNGPFEFSGPRLKSENVSREIGQCLKINMEHMLEKRQKLPTPYHTCAVELDVKKRKLMLDKIKENMDNLKNLMDKMRFEDNKRDRVLLDFFNIYVFNMPAKNLKEGFKKYENVMNFFFNTLTWTEERLDELDTKYWSRVTNFFNGPSIFSGIISNETEKALSDVSANMADIKQELMDRMRMIRTYHICGDEFTVETRMKLTHAIADELKSLKNDMDEMYLSEKKSNGYLIQDLYSRVWPMWTHSDKGFQAAFEVYHQLLNSFMSSLKNGFDEPSQLRKDFWKRIMQFVKMPVL
ncbi:uncharacterized protein LOC106667318 isoform X2 [Cimex lectularius]|uniref:Uncharacterized protein n=1 Tax=Cimex lectularius TaxID=79782 RepID=A0A8I6RV59_CIMLE|nr:uncharacterized protein LOC106667318 isoform X2 [Cimex lectularius]